MKGVLDLNRDNEWIVRYRAEDNDLLIHKSLPLSRFNKIINKNKLEIYSEIEFKIVKENDIISYCKCTNEEYDNCEFFVRSGINECLNYETVEIEAAKIESIIPNNNQTFDRELVKNLLIEVKNRFSAMNNDNYNSDLDVIEWFEINYPKK